VSFPPGILARGPWQRGQVAARWREDSFEPDAGQSAQADRAIAALQDRGSPTHDGLAARLCGYEVGDEGLRLELQPMRWSLRLGDNAAGSLSVLCVARDDDGRWLAGRRAPWVATWAGRWALGAGGAVEVGEDPVEALARELEEEWSVAPARLAVEALVSLPSGLVMLVGQAWLPPGAEVRRDAEHDDHAWWPRQPDAWPDHADPALRRMATLLDEA
jgi:8-oxo-dGTP diphosphatase